MNLNELLQDHEVYHSEFQMDTFIIGGRHLFDQYKQALRELYKRVRGLREIIVNKELLQVDIDEAEVNVPDDEFEKRRWTIRQKQRMGQMEEANRSLEHTRREALRFYKHAVCLKSQIGELTPEKRAKLEKESWLYTLKKRAAIQKISQGRVNDTTIKNIMGLPKEERLQFINEIKNDAHLIPWLEEKDDVSPSTELEHISNPPELEDINKIPQIELQPETPNG